MTGGGYVTSGGYNRLSIYLYNVPKTSRSERKGMGLMLLINLSHCFFCASRGRFARGPGKRHCLLSGNREERVCNNQGSVFDALPRGFHLGLHNRMYDFCRDDARARGAVEK